MYDRHAQALIAKLPRIEGLDPVACRRALSRAYLVVVNNRILTDATADWDEDQVDLQDTLRRMGNALESVAVFDPLNDVEVPNDALEASAFVAAEALALLARLVGRHGQSRPVEDPIQDQRTYTLAESALLYMVGGYDINAAAVIASAPKAFSPDSDDAFGSRCRSGRRLWRRIQAFCTGAVGKGASGPERSRGEPPPLVTALMNDTREVLYDALSDGLDLHFAWLRGEDGATGALAVERLALVRDACRPRRNADGLALGVSGFSDVFHLSSVLLAAVKGTQERSVVHGVPSPDGGAPEIRGRFGEYLRDRAVGPEGGRGRPLLWPSTVEFVRSCLPGPNRDAVVSMPTGSGKSFLAELAVAHALARGWVLYLAPTNALAHQIRRDLAVALKTFEDVQVSAFVGGAEYTTLSGDQLADGRVVAVMTPEKCALALRLYPNVFQGCSLCVFDECHLLNDGSRGAVADVLMAQLFHAAPEMKVLLMSAMISNADELAAWLAAVRTGPVANPPAASKIRWRPSRAARGFVFMDQKALEDARRDGRAQLLSSKKKALTISHEIPLAWLAGLSGPWTKDGPDDYRAAPLPVHATLHQSKSRNGQLGEEIESWKNRTGIVLAELLASRGMPAINFVLSSRHHAFGNADRVTAAMPGALGVSRLPPLVRAQLSIADEELGVPTCLRELLGRGIAVHTSAMLQVEQAASEWMFAHGSAKLMVATGTLAQGLNLPAAAVVVSGSQLPGQHLQDVDAAAGITRASELILNGFGRAGRPGFANQGVVVLVSDKPVYAPVTTTLDGASVLDEYPVLGEPDASIAVRSPIEKFLDELMAVETTGDATNLEVSLTALLSAVEGESENSATVLRRTFGGFSRRGSFTDQRADLARRRIADVRKRFLQADGVPPWMPNAAMKAGVPFLRAQRMWEAYAARGRPSRADLAALSVGGWFDLLIDVLSQMPIARVSNYLEQREAKTERASKTPRTRLGALATAYRGPPDAVPWMRPVGWDAEWKALGRVAFLYMQGRPYTEIGAALLGREASEFDSGRTGGAKSLTPVFKFIGDVIDRGLSLDAGCFLALHECWFEADELGDLPEELQGLPLCVRNGADNLNVLSWFRFGYRQRICAHALASAFPVGTEVRGDADRAVAVRELRREWLRGGDWQDEGATNSLLDCARVVVLEGGSDRN